MNDVSYFTNFNGQLLKKQIMADVNPDCWYMYNTNRISEWEKIPNPTIPYFNEKGESCKRETSIGLIEISNEKMKQLRGDRC